MEQLTDTEVGRAVPAMSATVEAGLAGALDAVSRCHPDLPAACEGARLALTLLMDNKADRRN